MSNADKLGMLPGFGWSVNVNPYAALAIAWLITPVMFYVVGIIGESRLAPIWRHQYRSFLPGDLFLGVLLACSVALVKYLPASSGHWYQSWIWHVIVVIIAANVALGMTLLLDAQAYETRALFSPTKLYHNVVLYVGFGYLLVVVAIPAVFITPWNDTTVVLKALALCCLAIWAALVVLDNMSDPALKAHYAHVRDWQPLWRH